MKLNMEISKSAVLLPNEHQSDQKNDINDFRISFRYVFVHAKTTPSRRILTKMIASVFHRT